jgi:polar amino acid transport system substrate-binding protein
MKKIMRKGPVFVLFLFLPLLLWSCAGTEGDNSASHTAVTHTAEPENLLKVGITTNYPPLVFKEDGRFRGVEIDLAKRLARELGRNVRAINMPWEKQIPALLQGKTDIIMSGMTVTAERTVRIAFTSPYLVTGLVAAIRNSDRELFTTVEDLKERNISIGVIRNTVGERYVRQNFIKASRIVLFDKTDHAAVALTENKITAFIHDAPAVMWAVSRHEAEICGLWESMKEEKIAWGVRKDNPELLAKLNEIIEKWRNDGTLDAIIAKWLPYQLSK